MADLQSTFALKLKAKCAKMHQKKFSWLLDPITISIHEAPNQREPSICSKSTLSGHWEQVEWIMRQCLRPCATLMDPSASVAYQVRSAYFSKRVNLRQQPEFFLHRPLPPKDLLPKFIVCNGYQWWNPDQNLRICACNCACRGKSSNV